MVLNQRSPWPVVIARVEQKDLRRVKNVDKTMSEVCRYIPSVVNPMRASMFVFKFFTLRQQKKKL